MDKLPALVNRLKALPWLAEALAALGGVVFLAQGWYFGRHMPSVIDEGMYLYKGYLFAIGRYSPYQDFGPWTDHMPLAFLIPGYVQRLLGPGLLTGRLYALALIALMLVGLWLIARRLGGRWWAAAAIWVVAPNPGLARIYSLAVSQVLVAAMIVWVLVFTLDGKRHRWQLWLGAALAAIVFLSRINLLPLLVFLIAYIFWQYGRREGWYATLIGAGIAIAGHAIYWPEILKMWAEIIPASIAPFLAPFAMPVAEEVYVRDFSDVGRVVSLFLGLRIHFIPLMGLLLAGLAWVHLKAEASAERFRDFVFLSALFAVLTLAHLAVTVGYNYCVFCFANYLAFFNSLGVLLLVISTPYCFTRLTGWRRSVVLLIVLGLLVGVFFGAKGEVIPPLLAIPRLQKGLNELAFLRQNPLLWVTLGLGLVALMAAGMLFALASYLSRNIAKYWPGLQLSFAGVLLALFLGGSFVLTPTRLFGGGKDETRDCSINVIPAYEVAGERLAGLIPSGSLVYYRVDSPVPLLYMPGVEVFPAQLSAAYSMRRGGDPQALARYGFWNEELADQWVAQADFILVEKRLVNHLNSLEGIDHFMWLANTPPFEACRPDSSILVYARVP